MKRKINRVGQNTLTVSLPSKWAKEKELQQGDEIELTELPEGLLLQQEGKSRESKRISINIDHFAYYSLSRYLTVLYRAGYDKITLIHNKHETFNDKKGKYLKTQDVIKKLVNRFVGSEIISQTSSKTEIECLVTEKQQDLNKIQKRIYFLIKETFSEILNAVNEDYATFHDSIYSHHDHIAKFINYYLRELIASDTPAAEKHMSYSLYMIIDKLIDKIRHISEKIHEYGCSKKIHNHLGQIFEIISDQFLSLYKQEYTRDLVKKRYNLVKKIEKEKYTPSELQVISEAKIFLDTINDFTELIVCQNLKKMEE